MPTLYGDHDPLAYVRRPGRRGQKNIVISVREGVVRVSAPLQTRDTHIEKILRQKLSWIHTVLQRQSEQIQVKQGESNQELKEVRYHGELLPVNYHPHPKQNWQVKKDGHTLNIYYPQHIKIQDVQSDTSRVQDSIRLYASYMCVLWLKDMAKQYLPQRLLTLAHRFGFHQVKRVTLRAQHGRWGSCSSQGNISINWRLIQAPVSVSDYVLVHELAHLKEPNHQPQFWAIVLQMMPDYETQKAWLRENGSALFDVDHIAPKRL